MALECKDSGVALLAEGLRETLVSSSRWILGWQIKVLGVITYIMTSPQNTDYELEMSSSRTSLILKLWEETSTVCLVTQLGISWQSSD